MAQIFKDAEKCVWLASSAVQFCRSIGREPKMAERGNLERLAPLYKTQGQGVWAARP